MHNLDDPDQASHEPGRNHAGWQNQLLHPFVPTQGETGAILEPVS